MSKRFPWKSNYRNIPPFVSDALSNIDGKLIAVAATKKIAKTDIESGLYAHVGLAAMKNRKASAPYWSIRPSGSTVLPFDFDIFEPSAARTSPCR